MFSLMNDNLLQKKASGTAHLKSAPSKIDENLSKIEKKSGFKARVFNSIIVALSNRRAKRQ